MTPTDDEILSVLTTWSYRHRHNQFEANVAAIGKLRRLFDDPSPVEPPAPRMSARLEIAAKMLAALATCPPTDSSGLSGDNRHDAKWALDLADALIEETEARS